MHIDSLLCLLGLNCGPEFKPVSNQCLLLCLSNTLYKNKHFTFSKELVPFPGEWVSCSGVADMYVQAMVMAPIEGHERKDHSECRESQEQQTFNLSGDATGVR